MFTLSAFPMSPCGLITTDLNSLHAIAVSSILFLFIHFLRAFLVLFCSCILWCLIHSIQHQMSKISFGLFVPHSSYSEILGSMYHITMNFRVCFRFCFSIIAAYVPSIVHSTPFFFVFISDSLLFGSFWFALGPYQPVSISWMKSKLQPKKMCLDGFHIL